MNKDYLVGQAQHVPVWDLIPPEGQAIIIELAEEKYDHHMERSLCALLNCGWHQKVAYTGKV